MKTLTLSIFLVLINFYSCGSAPRIMKKNNAKKKPDMQTQVKPKINPEKAAFIKAYNEISCRANFNYDPDSTFGTLKEPVNYLTRLLEDESSLLPGYESIITKNGFSSIKKFLEKAKQYKADSSFWSDVTADFMERLKNCKK